MAEWQPEDSRAARSGEAGRRAGGRRERSAEEREAARLERERRRAGVEAAFPDPDSRPPGAQAGSPGGDWDGEAAAGTRRVSWTERSAAVAETRPPGARPARPRAPSRHSRPGRALSLVVLLAAAALIWFLVELFQPFHGSGHGEVTVTVPPRAGASQVGSLLEHDGVVASGFFFNLRAALAGDRGKLYAGTYHLKLDMSYGQVLKVLSTPPRAVKVTNVTIVPGDTRHQIDALLRSQHVTGSYFALTRRSPLLSPSAYGAPPGTNSLEGFLFPDTYQLRSPISIPALVADQLAQFRRVLAGVNMSYARSRHLTAYDVLIIASIIEKEAATAHDRPLVASVIYNRLADHMALGMDSTTRYEFNDYTKPLTQSQLASASPYNTRLHTGLPPTPIGNPGLAAIEAAAHPARTNYLYFVVEPCGNGASVFSSSYAQFLRDSARYQSARAARGNRSPTKC